MHKERAKTGVSPDTAITGPMYHLPGAAYGLTRATDDGCAGAARLAGLHGVKERRRWIAMLLPQSR